MAVLGQPFRQAVDSQGLGDFPKEAARLKEQIAKRKLPALFVTQLGEIVKVYHALLASK